MACPQATQGAGLSACSPRRRGSVHPRRDKACLVSTIHHSSAACGLPLLSLTQRFSLLVFVLAILTTAQAKNITVSATGKADFTTIQAAINSLPDSATADRIIFIKNGTYNEKIFLTKHHIALIGEDREKTILTYDIARDAWRCDHKDDWGVATLNLSGSDITLQNLTIINGYGYNHKQPETIDCKADSTGKKIITAYGHQMALRSFATTRLKAINCSFKSFSGDTVSPWNTSDGMFYFKDCYMEGGVDFYCPRGWAYAENCTFFANHSDAAIWHDGSGGKDQKTVLKNCSFDGYEGFKLGRYHKDAAFYLINCTFSKNMADKPIYRVQTTNVIQWGERIYYANCHRTGGDFAWFKDNLTTAEKELTPQRVSEFWIFGNRWSEFSFDKMLNERIPSANIIPNTAISKTDSQAENMLLYQRTIGGWPKAVGDVKVDYTKTFTPAQKQATIEDASRNDATIDNGATTKEITHLVTAYKQTQNPAYKTAAEKGIRYLLKAQYANGGWPQYYPDASLYRHQITYNDDAMVHVLNVLQDVAEGKNDFDIVDPSLKPQCTTAVQKGIDCILKTQVKEAGQLTIWAAQYDEKTLQPAQARAFELVSLSSSESVGIIRFLMRQPNPSSEIKQSITAAVQWLDKNKITDFNFVSVPDATQPKGFDKRVVADANSTIWPRFYEIGTNRPLFSGRDSQKKYDVSQIEIERRNGYAWYGTWPQKLIDEQYTKWKKTINND